MLGRQDAGAGAGSEPASEPEPLPAAGRAAPEHCCRGGRSSGYGVGARHMPVFFKCVKRTCKDISRHPDGYINVTMDSIGCLNNIAYQHSMYKGQNFGTARQTAPAPAGQRGNDPIVARTASFTATAACNAPTAPYARRHRRSNAPGGICVRSRQRAHWPGNDRIRMRKRARACACVRSAQPARRRQRRARQQLARQEVAR